jgi:hypothetical protein
MSALPALPGHAAGSLPKLDTLAPVDFILSNYGYTGRQRGLFRQRFVLRKEESMLVGHFAVAFIGKRVEPKLSLGTLMLAAMLPDVLWPIFTMAGIEYAASISTGNYDIAMSHSLLMVAIWGALFAGGYFLIRHDKRAAWILFFAVLSHWVLDAISHKHSLAPGVTIYVGLGLWKHFLATILIEGGFWLAAIVVYVRATRAVKPMGTYGFWPVVAFLTFVWATNVRTGPPPPERIMGSLIFFLLLVVWAYWINTMRITKETVRPRR